MRKKLTPTAGPDAIAKRIETRRKELGWTLADLAREAGLKAPSYVLHIEKGEKVPSENVAERLALALGLGKEVESFTAWARLRTGSATLDDALRSARIAEHAVQAIKRDPRHQVRWARGKGGNTLPPHDPIVLLDAHADPDAHTRASARKLAIAVGTDDATRKHFAELVGPFAYRLTREFGRRAPNLLPPGYYVILTRRIFPLEPNEAYAVRVEGRVELGFIHWDGNERLLLLPHTDPADLVVLPAKSDEDVLHYVVGKVAALIQPELVKAPA